VIDLKTGASIFSANDHDQAKSDVLSEKDSFKLSTHPKSAENATIS
jgi:hypothetical protein